MQEQHRVDAATARAILTMDPTPDSAINILERAIATRLGGDRARVLELFEDDALHQVLRLHPGSYLNFREQGSDGHYLVARNGDFEYYYKERGSIYPPIERYPGLPYAAERFFKCVGYLKPYVPPTSVGGELSRRLAKPIRFIRAAMLMVLGFLFALNSAVSFWAADPDPVVLSALFFGAVAAISLGMGFRILTRDDT